jgi:hypothetical protein
MNYRILSLVSILILLAMVASHAEKPHAEKLVIIVINGVRYNDAFGKKNHVYINNIWRELLPEGTLCTKFDNSELTVPIPAQMSLLTGVWHILENPLNEKLRPAFPTLFEYWNSVRRKTGNSCYFASNLPAFENLSCREQQRHSTVGSSANALIWLSL